MLESCINVNVKLGVKKILINTFHLGQKVSQFIKDRDFPIDIQIVEDGKEILNTGGGILNMINQSKDENFLIFNPDTFWDEEYIEEINKMENFYFSKKLNNILLVTKKKLSFDQNLLGDFEMKKNLLKKNDELNFIYIGCQILNKELFRKHKIKNFSILEIWDELLKNDKLNGFESFNDFYHLTNLETFKKLKDL